MRLVIDACTVVAEVLRVSGRELMANRVLELFVAAEAWNEVRYELNKRWSIFRDHRSISDEGLTILQNTARTLMDRSLSIVPSHHYRDRLAEAAWRIPRDSNDMPSVALALELDCGIWTNDRNFFGCGLPVWVTETLRRYVAEQDTASG